MKNVQVFEFIEFVVFIGLKPWLERRGLQVGLLPLLQTTRKLLTTLGLQKPNKLKELNEPNQLKKLSHSTNPT
ncbi:MAG: hypothetical protein HF981_02500 [Desulfobacteraceae bacterium]|nr:hypothetical protein [Desulfobacteraceae bacterium]MBC2749234.1 hypothetical protein [Desulfobacteraceae bacterium]